MAKIKYNGQTYPVPEGSTAPATFDAMKMTMPELENATLEKDGDDYKAVVKHGKKG